MNEVLEVILSLSLSGGIVIIMLYLVLLLFEKKTLQTMAVLYLDDSHYPAFTSFCSATKFDE